MDRAYEGDKTRLPADSRGNVPVVAPARNGKSSGRYGKDLISGETQIKCFFCASCLP